MCTFKTLLCVCRQNARVTQARLCAATQRQTVRLLSPFAKRGKGRNAHTHNTHTQHATHTTHNTHTQLRWFGGVLRVSWESYSWSPMFERFLRFLDGQEDGTTERIRIAAQCVGDLQFRHDRRPSVSWVDGSNLGARHQVCEQSLNEVGNVIQQRQCHCNG